MSTTLSSGCISGFIGPSLGLVTKDMFPSAPYAGAYFTLFLLGLVNVAAVFFLHDLSAVPLELPSHSASAASSPLHSLQDPYILQSEAVKAYPSQERNESHPVLSERGSIIEKKETGKRHLSRIVSSYPFALPCALTTLAQTIMFIVMSNVGLEMKALSYSTVTESLVFDFHFFFMFFPGFFTGGLITAYGPLLVSLSG